MLLLSGSCSVIMLGTGEEKSSEKESEAVDARGHRSMRGSAVYTSALPAYRGRRLAHEAGAYALACFRGSEYDSCRAPSHSSGRNTQALTLQPRDKDAVLRSHTSHRSSIFTVEGHVLGYQQLSG